VKVLEEVWTHHFQKIPFFEEAHAQENPGRQLEMIRDAAPRFKEWFRQTGTVTAFHSFDLITLPYPRKYALWRAALSPVSYVWFTNRMFIVQWRSKGRVWTLLNEPTEYELASNTPYFAEQIRRYGEFLSHTLLSYRYSTVEKHLEAAGLRPEDIDFITYDHLHTQDVRRWLGTNKPQADISPDCPVRAYFPKAKLIVQRKEWDILPHLHPLQRIWYQPEKFADIPEERLLIIDGDVLLGPGVALMWTPGHTQGNQSLVVNTDSGIWVSSENGVAAECYAPMESGIPGLRRYTKKTGFEVVLNANTIENTARQYNSMIQEKLVADPCKDRPGLPQFFPSSELRGHIFAPGTRPSYQHKRVSFGKIIRPEKKEPR
jgi:hypothetical protein